MFYEILLTAGVYGSVGIAAKVFLWPTRKTKLPTVEEWSLKHANRCSPEQIIAAHCIDSIARRFDDWQIIEDGEQGWPSHDDFHTKYPTVNFYAVDRMLFNRNKYKNVKAVTIFYEKGSKHRPARNFNVNNVDFEDEEGCRIVDAFLKIKKQNDEVKRKAARALEEMKKNEARWNLAEDLLGMERNERGALVPKKPPRKCTNQFVKPGQKCLGSCCNSLSEGE